jgi:hypothetical protein
MLIETRKSDRSCDPRTIVRDPLDMRNLDTLRRLRDETSTATIAAAALRG